MRLMIRARFKAALHMLAHGNMFQGHRIWRLYSHFGFKTYRVFCSCGKDFK